MKKGYAFIFGVDGFGANVAPAYEQGIYLNREEGFKHLCQLNQQALNETDFEFYEEGYGEDYYPKSDKKLKRLEDSEQWDEFDKELSKHCLTDVTQICERIMQMDEPPFNFYSMVEVDIH